MTAETTLITVAVVVALLFAASRFMSKGRPKTPSQLRPGQPLPAFSALDENGGTVEASSLAGKPAIILFVRGNWCPFCNKQVKNLAEHYKEIGELGAKLIFVTPKPLETTRRVAEFFDIEFDFWLDEDLHIARELGLVLPAAVPDDSRAEYGEDTVWPTALVVDADNTIRYTSLSKFIFDRPKPDELVRQLKKL